MHSGPVGLVLALALSLPAQDKPPVVTADDLPQFRAAFAAMPATGPVVAIACRGSGEPVILTSGTDAGGQELSRQSLLPLLGLAKVLAADAISTQQKDLDTGSGAKLGGRELTVRELLDGTALLPDYFVLDGSEGVDAAVLRACGELAVAARMQLGATTLGAAEFVLLEPIAFAGRDKDWPSMLRTTLAPRVPGLDPMSADSLPDPARARMLLPAEDVVKLAAARPALLRTVLSIKDLATWWQWRSQQERRPWDNARMGWLEPTRTNAKEQRWTFGCAAMNFRQLACHYPAHKAGLLWIGGTRTNLDPLVRSFEADVMTAGVLEAETEMQQAMAAEQAARNAAVRQAAAAGGLGPVDAPPQKTAGAASLAGTRWCSAPAQGGSPVLKFAFGAGAKAPLTVTAGPDTVSSPATIRTGDGYWTRGTSGDGSQRLLHLWPQPGGDQPVKLGVVMVTTRMAGTAVRGGGSMGSAVPQFVELVPEAK